MGTMTSSNAVSQLLEKIPELASYRPGFEADLPYDTFGSFALFLCDEIRAGRNKDLLDRAFEVLNEMADSSDREVLNLLVVGVFEVLSNDDTCIEAATKHLSEAGNRLLQRTLSGWNQSP